MERPSSASAHQEPHDYHPDAHARPILKRKGSTVKEGHIKWDEPTIAEQEREREENPKMKIDEPPTPYNHEGAEGSEDEGNQSDDGGNDHKDIHARMVMAVAQLGESAAASGSVSPGARPQTPERPGSAGADHEKFKQMRKAVYADEGAKFKELLRRGIPDDEADADEGDEKS